MTVKIYTSPLSKKHDTGHAHPESPARIEILEKLFADHHYTTLPAIPADLETIMLAHTEDYIFDLQDKTPCFGLTPLDGAETILSPNSYDAALYAAGAVCNAVDDTFNHTNDDCSTDSPSGLPAWRQRKTQRPPACGHDGHKNAQRAFCAIRPPGHHAEPSQAMGFCLFNNIFIGARYAQEKYDLKKIAIVDFDVHHGNGTETMCRTHNIEHPDRPVFYISTHGYPLYPMSGNPEDNNNTLLNIRLPEECGSADFHDIYEKQVFPALENFAPDLLMLSSGFDAHKDDPLANIHLETADYGWLTRKLCKIADKYCHGHLISVLEGGYQLEALKDCVRVHLQELAA